MTEKIIVGINLYGVESIEVERIIKTIQMEGFHPSVVMVLFGDTMKVIDAMQTLERPQVLNLIKNVSEARKEIQIINLINLSGFLSDEYIYGQVNDRIPDKFEMDIYKAKQLILFQKVDALIFIDKYVPTIMSKRKEYCADEVEVTRMFSDDNEHGVSYMELILKAIDEVKKHAVIS